MDLNDQARVVLTKSGADIINKKNKSTLVLADRISIR